MKHVAHPHPARGRSTGPLLTWGLVLALAMLSFFAHLVSDHVARSTARQAQPQPLATAVHAAPVYAVMH